MYLCSFLRLFSATLGTTLGKITPFFFLAYSFVCLISMLSTFFPFGKQTVERCHSRYIATKLVSVMLAISVYVERYVAYHYYSPIFLRNHLYLISLWHQKCPNLLTKDKAGHFISSNVCATFNMQSLFGRSLLVSAIHSSKIDNSISHIEKYFPLTISWAFTPNSANILMM